jgi:hypothetical protein
MAAKWFYSSGNQRIMEKPMSLIKWADQDKDTLVYATVIRTFYSRSELCNMLRVINSAEVTIVEYMPGAEKGLEVLMRVGFSAAETHVADIDLGHPGLSDGFLYIAFAEAIIDEAIYTGYLVARDLDLEFDYGWEI